MAKNILIFSDGTGQIGGVRPDQTLSNVYKMYRAMRPGPDSPIDPGDQVAFYDPGLGSGLGGGNILARVRNILSSAFGTGISENIVDCYEAILVSYEPGDRIFLFGFSRGAYTARCVANVLNLCGVPTRMADGGRLPGRGPRLRALAGEAVYRVYEHGSGKDRREYELEREEQARRFRAKYGSEGTGTCGEGQGNVAPTFIGVFDSVAALGSLMVRRLLFGTLAISALLALWAFSNGWNLLGAIAVLPCVFIATSLVAAGVRQVKWIKDGPAEEGISWHVAAWNLKNYDRFLDTSVGWARHALSIDENRKRFPRVEWGSGTDFQSVADRQPLWLDQVWFAGNHSDIGGSYPEDQSRLSDLALAWMLEELRSIPNPPYLRDELIRTYGDPVDLQHDEVKASRDSWFPGWWPRSLRFGWIEQTRPIHTEAKLHPSVLARLEAESVRYYDGRGPYRPPALSGHVVAGAHYLPDERGAMSARAGAGMKTGGDS